MAPNCALKLPPWDCRVETSGIRAPPALQQSRVPLSNPPFDNVSLIHVAGVVPSPVRLAVREPPGPLSVTVRVPVLTPEAVGRKVTVSVQLAFGAIEAPQLLLC